MSRVPSQHSHLAAQHSYPRRIFQAFWGQAEKATGKSLAVKAGPSQGCLDSQLACGTLGGPQNRQKNGPSTILLVSTLSNV